MTKFHDGDHCHARLDGAIVYDGGFSHVRYFDPLGIPLDRAIVAWVPMARTLSPATVRLIAPRLLMDAIALGIIALFAGGILTPSMKGAGEEPPICREQFQSVVRNVVAAFHNTRLQSARGSGGHVL